ncbi:hypothetical protein Tco_0725336 [Tanacetum coccineum]|uniref:Reverse transcriptase domain-containing protein n=1 Tax=Tanacetum coccineum TaxID=301880 RepID=A0ABQ4YDC7_9ASTR
MQEVICFTKDWMCPLDRFLIVREVTSTRNKSSNTSHGLATIQAQLNNLEREIKKVNERVYASLVGRYRAAASGFYQRDNGNTSYQERRQTMEESLNKFIAESAKRHDEHSSLIKEIRALTDTAIKNQGASIKALEIQIVQISNSITTTEEAKTPSIRRIGSDQYAVSSHKKDEKMPLIEISRASVPFPGHLKEKSYKEKEVLMKLKKLQVDLIESAKSLRRLLKEKLRIEEEIKATMHKHCSTTLKDDLPPKEKDLESFTLPCKINDMCFDKALADLGASVSVMPYSTFTNLGLDFIVLDMPEDIKIPLILGRSFLSTAHANIDVFKRKIALRIGNDKIVFKSDIPTSNIIKKVYMLGLRERMELDLKLIPMGKELILNRSQDLEFRDFL